jgi:Flp pilus assembly protein TadB
MSLEPKPAADASLSQLMSELSSQTSRLVRDEMRLVQKEFQESAKHAGIGAGLFSVAGLLAVFGFATIVTAAVAALSLALPVWAAALIVAAVLLLAAGVTGLISKQQVQRASPAPERTVANLKKDIEEVKEARHDRA